MKIILEECPNVEEDKEELVHPSSVRGEAHKDLLLHVSVETFHHAVSAGMVGRPPDPLITQNNHELAPELGLVLLAAIDSHRGRRAESGNPGAEGLGYCGSGDAADGAREPYFSGRP